MKLTNSDIKKVFSSFFGNIKLQLSDNKWISLVPSDFDKAVNLAFRQKKKFALEIEDNQITDFKLEGKGANEVRGVGGRFKE